MLRLRNNNCNELDQIVYTSLCIAAKKQDLKKCIITFVNTKIEQIKIIFFL